MPPITVGISVVLTMIKLEKKKEAHSKDAWDEEAKDLDQDVSAYIIETSIEFSQIHGKEDHGRKVGTTNF